MDAYYLIDAEYTREGIKLVFYDPTDDSIREIVNGDYWPYFYMPHPLDRRDRKIIEALSGVIETVEKRELFTGKIKILTKVKVKDPSNIQIILKKVKMTWEEDIPPSFSYIYDHDLSFGALHYVSDKSIVPINQIPTNLKPIFEEKFRELRERDPSKYSLIRRLFSLCSQPIPRASPAKIGIAGNVDREQLYLIFMLSRITGLPIPIAGVNKKVSLWIRSMLYAYLRRENILIPRPQEIMRGEETRRVRGGLIIPPESGIHFNTVVVDFESLYPSIIDAYNLSYETIDCGHHECIKNKVPDTNHYVCTKRRGVYSILIGALKDLRIKWFKPISRDKSLSNIDRSLAEAAAKLLKLILVASYGVTVRIRGLAQLALAESITAYGRYSLRKAWKISTELGLHPIYGDTDSLFLENPPEDSLNKLIKKVKENLRLDLVVDKRYSICVLPRAMKAYFGIQLDGAVDIKGLTAIKSNSPLIIQKVFARCVKELTGVKNWTEFELAKERIRRIVREAIEDLKSGNVPLNDLEYTVNLHFDPYQRNREGETLHQPYQCAIQLIDRGVKINVGDKVRFIKVKPFKYAGKTFSVKPTHLIKSFHEVNIEDYIRNLVSALNQTFKSIGISFYQPTHKDLAEFM